MSDKILIIDFDDSFTYNVANILYPFEESCRVIAHRDFFLGSALEDYLFANEKRAIILGPGPGHPSEYHDYFVNIKRLMNAPHIYLLGICLGHQLMASAQGFEIADAKEKIHGMATPITFGGKELWVQRYNSLAVFSGERELDVISYKNGISYQFHPESVGTTDNYLFFCELLEFVKNN